MKHQSTILCLCILVCSLHWPVQSHATPIPQQESDVDVALLKLIQQNKGSKAVDKFLRDGTDPGGSPIRKLGEFSVGGATTKIRSFVFLHDSTDIHYVVTATKNYKIIDDQVGSGSSRDLRAVIESEPFRHELIVGKNSPSHYSISKDGSIETIFASKTGLIPKDQLDAQRNYLNAFPWGMEIQPATEKQMSKKWTSNRPDTPGERHKLLQKFLDNETDLRSKYDDMGLFVRPKFYDVDGSIITTAGWALLDGEPAILPIGLDMLTVVAGDGDDMKLLTRDPQLVLASLSEYLVERREPCRHYEIRVPEAEKSKLLSAIEKMPEYFYEPK